MAFLSLFAGGKGTHVRADSAAASESRALAFAPRRALGSVPGAGLPPPNTKLPSVLGPQPPTFARGREALALVLWTFAVFLAMALASYAGDPNMVPSAPTLPGTEGPPPQVVGENWVGPVGAVVARGFVTLVGVAAWVVPLEALLLGIPFVRGRRSTVTPSRMAGDILMVVIGAALVQVGSPSRLAFGRHPAGGMVGELFGELARSLFSTAGSFLVGFALLGLILIGRASFSFIAMMRGLARLGDTLTAKALAAFRALAGAWAKAREIDREKRAQREKDNEPHIAREASGDATILVPEEDPDDAEVMRDSEPEIPKAKVRIVTAAKEPFAEESPLVVVAPLGHARKLRVISVRLQIAISDARAGF